MDRRSVLRVGVAVGVGASGGCLSRLREEAGVDDADGETSRIARVEDPPDAVYVPSHRETMERLEPARAGDYAVAPMVTYAHPFWLVDGSETTLVEPQGGPEVHLMIALREPETGAALPVASGARLRLEHDGESIGSVSPWPMISQGMGAHFGDNVPLEGDGTYAVEVELPPLGVRTTGTLAGRFETFETATFEFTYDEAFREAVADVEYLDEELWGRRGALEPTGHGGGDGDEGNDSNADDDRSGHEGDEGGMAHSVSALAPAEEYPGLLGAPERDDAVLVTALLEPGSRFAENGERYLLVSPRTPYNRVPLADMAMTATVARGDEAVEEADLVQTIDGEYGHHYGAGVAELAEGDALTVAIEGVPQVARHQGYETAFLEMEPIELTVGGA
ncbi:iron transporter [Saliphagus infecundisoli]|uniref:Iron transporter n=1 Tax=Saliphagus infecundisoli TaxID=1849069 RepID=A0ABD5QD07_9EURY|nr:iron transporter [Saliphagus infecundisoli]